MTTMTIDQEPYAPGYSDHEAKRLAEQAIYFEDLTADVLRRAGLQPGMRVLDLGCGVGDVSLLAAQFVGDSGSVLGVDRAAASLETARRRAAASGVSCVRFAEAALETFDPNETFDAIIGRLVLMYLPDPTAVLQRLRQKLRPGGIVAFQEIEDMARVHQTPSSPLFGRMLGWIMAAFRATGAETAMGSKLARTFLRAGLPRPAMIAAGRVESGPESAVYQVLADLVRSLSPVIERFGIANAEQIDIEMLAERLRQDAVENERLTFPPTFIGAWTKTPSA